MKRLNTLNCIVRTLTLFLLFAFSQTLMAQSVLDYAQKMAWKFAPAVATESWEVLLPAQEADTIFYAQLAKAELVATDVNGRPIEIQVLSRVANNWLPVQKATIMHAPDGKIIGMQEFEWSPEGWSPRAKIERTINDSGEDAAFIFQTFQEGEWQVEIHWKESPTRSNSITAAGAHP